MHIFTASDIVNTLSENDTVLIQAVAKRYEHIMNLCAQRKTYESAEFSQKIIHLYEDIGNELKDIVQRTPRLSVYSFNYPNANHGEVSRIVAKLRNSSTKQSEFLYYTQRAFELLFSLAFTSTQKKRTHIVVKTPVERPADAYAVHRIPDVDDVVDNTVMCVLLRGALLPSVIVSKEIEEFSSKHYLTPFALFKVRRDETETKETMRYIINPQESYCDISELNGKHLIFADPMNATAGSLLAIMDMLTKLGVRPSQTTVLSIISSLEGALRTVRTVENCMCHTLWLDPVLNKQGYIVPGLGDAGDRLNGIDDATCQRGIMRLLADFGTMHSLYTKQFHAIERTVLQAPTAWREAL